MGQRHLVVTFDLLITLAERRVVGEFFQPAQRIEIVRPFHLQRLVDQARQRRVTLFQPATRRDAVGDVMEFVRPQLVIFREQIFHHQIRVQLRHAVDRKAADHAQVGHAHLLVVMHRQFGPHRLVARPVLIHLLLNLALICLMIEK